MKRIEGFLSKLLDNLSEYLASRKGLLPLLGTALIVLNLIFKILMPESYLTQVDLFLHLGLVITILGLVLSKAL